MNNARTRFIWGSLIALSVVFGLQLIRVLLPLFGYFLRDTKGVSPLTLAPIAIGIFALSFLAAPLRKLVGQPFALLFSAGGLAIARAAEQVSYDSMVDLILAAVGVWLFTMFLPIALEIVRSAGATGTIHFAMYFLVGITVDTAIHTVAETVDLSWQSGFIATVVVFILAIVILDILWLLLKKENSFRPVKEPGQEWGWQQILALSGLGPWLFLQLVIFQNVARMAASSGWSLPVAGLIIGLGNVIGLVAAIHAPRSRRVPGSIPIVALAFILFAYFANEAGLVGVIASVAAQVLAASLLSTLFLSIGYSAEGAGSSGPSAANGIAQLIFVILTFLYYVSYDMNLGFRPQVILIAATVVFSLTALAVTLRVTPGTNPDQDYRPVVIAVVLLLLPLIQLQNWKYPDSKTPDADNSLVRVMDYNLHNGFNTNGQLNMEDLAQVIEGADADVIALQEVSRGWLLNGSVDMMEWLSHRLELPYVYGPTEGLLWGNAILSRYPIVTTELVPLPPDSLRLHRGYLAAHIDIGQERVQIIDTHLHHIGADSHIRQEQVPVLVEGWNGSPRTILMGDLNAQPNAPEMLALADAGLLNVTAEIGPTPSFTYYSANPDHQIDYIWISPDLEPLEANIPQTTASDHLPIVATIRVP